MITCPWDNQNLWILQFIGLNRQVKQPNSIQKQKMDKSSKGQTKKVQQTSSNFLETKDMLKNYATQKRYSYVWDQLLKFYHRNGSSIANFESLECAKIGFYAYERLFYNYFRKNKKSVQNGNMGNLDSRFKFLVGILGDCRNMILAQMHYQNPQYFNMFFRMESDTMFKKVIGKKHIFQANLKNIKQNDIKPEKQLLLLFKKVIKSACLLLIYQIKYKSLQQILHLFQIADSFISIFSVKFFASEIMIYDLLKFDVIEAYSISSEIINLKYQFPIELVYKIYQCSKAQKTPKAMHLYNKCQRYILLSLKHFQLSKVELKIIYQQCHLLINSISLPMSDKFNEVIDFLGQKLNRQLALRQQIGLLIKKHIPNIGSYINHQKIFSKNPDKDEKEENKVKKSMSSNLQASGSGFRKKNRQSEILKNVFDVSVTLNKKSKKNKIAEKKGLLTLFKKLKFNKIEILDQSSDQQGQIHGFQIARRKKIASLHQSKKQAGSVVANTDNLEEQLQQLREEAKNKQFFQQIHYLDEVVSTEIKKKLNQSVKYRSVSENHAIMNELKFGIQKFDKTRQEEVKMLREKSKNRFFNEIVREQVIVVNLKSNWIKNKPKPKLKIMESKNKQFLKHEVSKQKIDDSKYKKNIILSDSYDKLSKKLNFRFNTNNDQSNQIG